ncbi:MAG TPA: HAMP domain-containing sensor histidine kinase [Polyangia bacterium]|jgi:signal transduction histidine kinase
MFALVAAIATAFVRSQDLDGALRRCTEELVRQLEVAFARVWTVDDTGRVLLLRASAGLYTHIDGGHARVEIGRYKIGMIAQQRCPHLTNAVIGDPLVPEQDWARREGLVAFAGYPLVAGDRLVGVMAMFARHALPPATLEALGSVAEVVTVGIERAGAGELRVAMERAEEAARAKSEVLNVVAHELRTPLSVIGIVTDQLRRGQVEGRPTEPETLERLERQTRRLTRLVDDLQAAARLERGQLALTRQPIDLYPVVAEAVADMQERAPGRTLRLEAADAPAPVDADAARIAQVVGNLLENALNYSPEQADVEARLSTSAGEVRVAVTDHGPGIAARDREAVFAPFVRLPAAGGGGAGLGLGLHICRLITTLHGGRIGVDSEPGRGSTFWFTLPRRG